MVFQYSKKNNKVGGHTQYFIEHQRAPVWLCIMFLQRAHHLQYHVDFHLNIVTPHSSLPIVKNLLHNGGAVVGVVAGLFKVANSKGQTDRLARILWLRGH